MSNALVLQITSTNVLLPSSRGPSFSFSISRFTSLPGGGGHGGSGLAAERRPTTVDVAQFHRQPRVQSDQCHERTHRPEDEVAVRRLADEELLFLLENVHLFTSRITPRLKVGRVVMVFGE